MANSFLCKALIEESSGDYSAAAWSLIYAAWVCDDAEMDDPAKTCRSKAADMIRKALENSQQISDQAGAVTAIQVDLLRRAGRLGDARQLVLRQESAITEDVILKLLAFQKNLISNGDQSCHKLSEALGENKFCPLYLLEDLM